MKCGHHCHLQSTDCSLANSHMYRSKQSNQSTHSRQHMLQTTFDHLCISLLCCLPQPPVAWQPLPMHQHIYENVVCTHYSCAPICMMDVAVFMWAGTFSRSECRICLHCCAYIASQSPWPQCPWRLTRIAAAPKQPLQFLGLFAPKNLSSMATHSCCCLEQLGLDSCCCLPEATGDRTPLRVHHLA
jgi:hypothetical protein